MTTFEQQFRTFLDEHFPSVVARTPQEAVFGEGMRWAGFYTHGVEPERWVHSQGGSWFAKAPGVPEGYWACGAQPGGGSEYLFVLAADGGRRFAFYSQYTNYFSESSASTQQTQSELEQALARWDDGGRVVVYSGPWGWYRPEQDRYSLEPDRDDKSEMAKMMRLFKSTGDVHRPKDAAP